MVLIKLQGTVCAAKIGTTDAILFFYLFKTKCLLTPLDDKSSMQYCMIMVITKKKNVKHTYFHRQTIEKLFTLDFNIDFSEKSFLFSLKSTLKSRVNKFSLVYLLTQWALSIAFNREQLFAQQGNSLSYYKYYIQGNFLIHSQYVKR